MASATITIQGIDKAISSLKYKDSSIKGRVILAIRQYYTSDAASSLLESIDADELIKIIWDTGDDPYKIKSKRRNFYSIRSSINSDLAELSTETDNPEKITISSENIFDMTEEAKNSLLNSFSEVTKDGKLDINQIADVLKTITDMLSRMDIPKDSENSKFSDTLDMIKNKLMSITDSVEIDQGNKEDTTLTEEVVTDEPIENVEEIDDDDAEIVDVEDSEVEEIDDDTEIVDVEDEDEEVEEIDDDAEIVDVEDGEVEEIDDDDAEIVDVEDGEVEEIDDDTEIVDVEDEEVEEIDDDTEIVDVEDEDEEVEEIDDDTEIVDVEEGEVEEIDDDTEIVDVEDEDEEVEEIDDDDAEIVDVEDEEVEEIDDDDTEIVDVEDEEVEEIDDDTEIVDVEDEEVEEIDDDTEIVDVEDEELVDEDDLFEEVQDITEQDDLFEEVIIDENQDILVDDKELEEFREFQKNKELARQFDNLLADADKKYNTYIVVPAGIYTVGSIQKTKNKLELQQIEMQKLYVAKYPVTNSLFEIFIQETGYVTTAEKKGYGTVFYGRFRKDKKASIWKQGVESIDIKHACWYQPEGAGTSLHNKRNHPVVQVSVDDAWAFASWIGRRLPTETEWEAAARTDMGFKYPWGNEWTDDYCNIEKSAISDTTPVDKYEKHSNIFNITDMLGNVMEWTSDLVSNPFSADSKNKFHVAKGCGWIAKNNISIGARSLFKPQYTSNTVGFRCISEYLL